MKQHTIAKDVAVGDDFARRDDDPAAEAYHHPVGILAFDRHAARGRFVEDLLGVHSSNARGGGDEYGATEQSATEAVARNHARLSAFVELVLRQQYRPRK